MNIEDLMTLSVRTCVPGDALSTAAQHMWEADCGCIPVLSDDGRRRVVGVITDRDICMASHFQGRPPGAILVGEVMSTGVCSVGPSESLSGAEKIMRDARVRRLPVVDQDRQLLGVVSLADLAREADRDRQLDAPAITEQEIGDTLTAICAPRIAAQPAAPA